MGWFLIIYFHSSMYFHHYGPSFELTLLPSNHKNLNTASSLADTLAKVRSNLRNLCESRDLQTEASHDILPNDFHLGLHDHLSVSHDHRSTRI